VARFKRLTDAEARALTRAELLDRIEAEQAYWSRKHTMTDADCTAEREFRRIMHTYLNPADGLAALRDVLEGRPNNYWETRPEPQPEPEAEARESPEDPPAEYLAKGKVPM
jgi:hypothetical protein